MPRELHVDVLIFGGGIAGLWTLARLRKEGYSCLLLESNALGAGQTIASQGIIHGGIKYALTGQASAASKAIAEMPGIWRACLEGTGEIDLRRVKVLSERQYLWTSGSIGSRFVGLAASKVIRTSVERVPPEQRPEWLRGAPRSVDVYGVDEPILDPQSLLESLASHGRGCIARFERCERGLSQLIQEHGRTVGSWVSAQKGAAFGGIPVRARRIVFCAGEANHDYVRLPAGETQLRPLHMVMARAQHYRPQLPFVYGHCIGLSDKPRLTITSQLDPGGQVVWYIGGEIAERGVALSGVDLISEAKIVVQECLPWLEVNGTQWATLRVNRSEGVGTGIRPDEPVLRENVHGIAVWPTKLAFAPLAATRVLEALDMGGIRPSGGTVEVLPDNPPSVASLPWNQIGLQWI